jgi:hypothetical protein
MPKQSRSRAEDEPVFVRHPPVLNSDPIGSSYYTVPYPYRFKLDKGWIFALSLIVAGAITGSPFCKVLGWFIAIMRLWIWLTLNSP